MPDRRAHRGLHPRDRELFSTSSLGVLRAATADLSWLYGRGYASPSALKLVGDRYQLRERQRAAVSRCACPQALADARRSRQLAPSQLRGEILCIDGFNVLTTLEVALSGGVLLIGRDGVMRDIAGVHGSYRQVTETPPAIGLLGELTRTWGVAACELYLDQPVSNSGRLRATLQEAARALQLPWSAHVVRDPDRVLSSSPHVVASGDGQILDAAVRWTNLARECVAHGVPGAYSVDLSGEP